MVRWPAGGSVRNTGNNTGTGISSDAHPTRGSGITHTHGITRAHAIPGGSRNACINTTPGDPGDPGGRNTAPGSSDIPGSIAVEIAGSTI